MNILSKIAGRPWKAGGWLLAAAGLVAVFLLANRPLVTGAAVPLYWDADSQFAPWQSLVADFARNGRLLLWNPWSSGGSPDFAEPQFGALSPFAVGIGLLTGGTLKGFLVYWFASWLLAGFGMLLLARHLDAPPWAGFVAALGFMFSGFFTGHAEHTPFIHAMAWLPWIVWRLDVALESRRDLPALQAGALLGLAALAGYPGVVIQDFLFAGLWAVARGAAGWPDTGTRVSPWRILLSLGTLYAVAAVVLAPTYVGFLVDGAGYTDRVGTLSRDVVTSSNVLAPTALATVASPYLTPLSMYPINGLWPESDFSSSSVYMGPILTTLALFALLMQPRRRWTWTLILLGALALCCAVASALPLRGWLYDWLPPFRYARHAATFRGPAIFFATVLALAGAREFHRALTRGRARGLALAALSALLAAAAAGWVYYRFVHGARRLDDDLPLADLLAVLGWVGVLAATLIALLVRSPSGRITAITLLAAIAATDAVLGVRLSRDMIYTQHRYFVEERAAIDQHHSSWLDLTCTGMERKLEFKSAGILNNKNLPLKIPVLNSYVATVNRFHAGWIADPALIATAITTNRVWFAPRATVVPASEEAFAAFRKRVDRDGLLPMLVTEPEAMKKGKSASTPTDADPLSGASPGARIGVRLASYTPDSLRFSVRCPSDGWLLVTDRWAPGWSVRVNGLPRKLWVGTFIFRAVEVVAGENNVEFSYRPFGYPWLIVASWTTLGIIVLGSIRAARRAGSTE